MFTFNEQQKQFEQVAEKTKQMYEFWYNAVVTTLKDFYKTGK